MNDKPVDYPRLDYEHRQHHARFQRYVETNGLLCQDCGGRGSHGGGSYEPPEPCGWCESTGRTTRWLRGEWLRYHREHKVYGCYSRSRREARRRRRGKSGARKKTTATGSSARKSTSAIGAAAATAGAATR